MFITIRKIVTLFIVYSKSEYTLESVSVRPAVHLHDNVRKESKIVMKFSTKFSLINVSVDFEDEPDWGNSSSDMAKNTHFSLWSLIRKSTYICFHNFFYHSQNKTPTIVYNSIENLTSYKIVYKTLKI